MGSHPPFRPGAYRSEYQWRQRPGVTGREEKDYRDDEDWGGTRNASSVPLSLVRGHARNRGLPPDKNSRNTGPALAQRYEHPESPPSAAAHFVDRGDDDQKGQS